MGWENQVNFKKVIGNDAQYIVKMQLLYKMESELGYWKTIECFSFLLVSNLSTLFSKNKK